MTINPHTALVTSALAGSILLALKPPGNRLIPTLGLIAAALLALIDYKIIQFSVARFRIDVILPAVLVVAGAICWSRSSTRPAITAATVVTIAALILLLAALKVLTG